MCKKTNYCNVRVDNCLKVLINSLNEVFRDNIKTIACCCGHGKYAMTIVVSIRRRYSIDVVDLVSGKRINRSRNIYKRDNEGFYYIPEVLE